MIVNIIRKVLHDILRKIMPKKNEVILSKSDWEKRKTLEEGNCIREKGIINDK